MVTGGVKVDLDEVRTLRYTTPAFIRLEQETGKTTGQLQEMLGAGSIYTITALIWAGLLHAEPRLTVEQAAERLDLRDLEDVVTAVGQAMEHALGAGGDEGNEEAADPAG